MCNIEKYDYKCIDGSCRDFPEFCRSEHPACWKSNKRYFCRDEELCRHDDTECLRTCGFKQEVYVFNVTCTTHAHRNLCARDKQYCPPQCHFPDIFRCPNGHCVKNENYCTSCPFKRCEGTGECYQEMDECDGKPFCQDKTDEKSCGDNSMRSSYSSLDVDPWVLAILIGAGVFLLIIFIICCFRTRYGKRGRGCTVSGGRRSARSISTILPGRANLQTSLMMTPLAIDGLDTVFLYRDEPVRRNPESPAENPTAAPPPSYTYVIQNDDKFKKPIVSQSDHDSGLPSYAEAVEILMESSNRIPP